MPKKRKSKKFIILFVLSIVIWQYIQNGIYFRYWLTNRLLYTAWLRTRASEEQVKPWFGAESQPLARLSIPRLDVSKVILSQVSNQQSLSVFAISHSNYSVLPGEFGNSVLNIFHQYTFNDFLKNLKKGDILTLESLHNGNWNYQVSEIIITTQEDLYWLKPVLKRRLTLISCNPCLGVNNSRYIVIAEESDSSL